MFIFNVVLLHLHLKSNLRGILIGFYFRKMIAQLSAKGLDQNNIKASSSKSMHLDSRRSLGIALGEITKGGEGRMEWN